MDKKKEVIEMAKNNLKKKVKKRIKTEAGYMKKGAKRLGKIVVKKTKAWMKGQIEAARETARLEAEIEREARKAEAEAFRKEAKKQARLRGRAKAKKRLGVRGALVGLGEIGERMSPSETLGFKELAKERKAEPVVRQKEIAGLAEISTSEYMFGGLGKQQKQFKGFEVERITLRRKKPKKKRRK